MVRAIRAVHVSAASTLGPRDDRPRRSVDGRAWNRRPTACDGPWSSLGRGTTYWLRVRAAKGAGVAGAAGAVGPAAGRAIAGASAAGATCVRCAGATENAPVGSAGGAGAIPVGLVDADVGGSTVEPAGSTAAASAEAALASSGAPADGSSASIAIAVRRERQRRHSAWPAEVNRPQVWQRARADGARAARPLSSGDLTSMQRSLPDLWPMVITAVRRPQSTPSSPSLRRIPYTGTGRGSRVSMPVARSEGVDGGCPCRIPAIVTSASSRPASARC
jgi:hypothetical protein